MYYLGMNYEVERVGMRGRDTHGRTPKAIGHNDPNTLPWVGRVQIWTWFAKAISKSWLI